MTIHLLIDRGVTMLTAATVTCPDKLVPKHLHWPRMRDELSAADWDLLLCSAGTLSAILCEHAWQVGQKGLDVGAIDVQLMRNEQSSPP